jgi:hypothetical protein
MRLAALAMVGRKASTTRRKSAGLSAPRGSKHMQIIGKLRTFCKS